MEKCLCDWAGLGMTRTVIDSVFNSADLIGFAGSWGPSGKPCEPAHTLGNNARPVCALSYGPAGPFEGIWPPRLNPDRRCRRTRSYGMQLNVRAFLGASALALGLLPMQLARAETPVSVKLEVNFLLGFIEGSECAFYRNGTWHDSKAAQAHIRDKYKYLAAGNLIHSTEEFIDKAASQSSLTGQAYQVKCNGGAAMESKQWLRSELARMRQDRGS